MSGLDMICGATSGVVIVTILDFKEVVCQVLGYLGGVVYLGFLVIKIILPGVTSDF